MALGVIAVGLSACGPTKTSDNGKVSVVANFYPIAYAAQRVGGDLVTVRNLTPAGVEPHDLELTSDEVDHIDAADVVFFMGSGFQPAVAAAAKRRSGNSVDVSSGLLATGDAATIARQEGQQPKAGATDPHFWLDPTRMARAVDAIRSALDRADPGHAATYDRNATAYKQELAQLDADFAAGLAHCARTEIVTAHAAFYYLAQRYRLSQYGITGVSPDAEPDPQRLADLSDRITRDGITTVFYEELVPRDFADTLAHDAHVQTAVLSPLEGLSKDEQTKGDTYISVMRKNLAALMTALGC